MFQAELPMMIEVVTYSFTIQFVSVPLLFHLCVFLFISNKKMKKTETKRNLITNDHYRLFSLDIFIPFFPFVFVD